MGPHRCACKNGKECTLCRLYRTDFRYRLLWESGKVENGGDKPLPTCQHLSRRVRAPDGAYKKVECFKPG